MFPGDLEGYTFEGGCRNGDSVYTILCEFEKFFFSHKLKGKIREKKDQIQGYFLARIVATFFFSGKINRLLSGSLCFSPPT